MRTQSTLLGTIAILLVVSGAAAAQPAVDEVTEGIGPDDIINYVHDVIGDAPGSGDGDGGADEGAGGDDEGAGTGDGLGTGFMADLVSPAGLLAMGGLGLLGLLGGGAWLMARYVDPKEALENPQRAMLYGFIKGNPGVHLKQLSDDFDMKTSTVLWHIRKLEAAELVRSQKVNGFRVFYPVAGGLEAKKLGAAVTALTNQNASRILDLLVIRPGADQRALSETLEVNAGTVRWHLRKMRDMGLLAELSQGRTSTYYPTELGMKALHRTNGLPVDMKPTADVVTHGVPTA